MEIVEGVHRIDTPLGERVNSIYLLDGTDASLLFDTGVDGTAQRDLAPYLDEHGLDSSKVRWVLASHPDVDHFGGFASLRDLLPEAIFGCHRDDAPLIQDYDVYENRRGNAFREPWGLHESPDVLTWTREVCREAPMDLLVTGGETIHLGSGWEVEVLHAPGHSRGHLSLWDPRSRSLIVSDAVLSDAVRLADGTPAFPPTYRYTDAYLATIARFESMDASHLLTAHYPTMDAEEGRAFLAASRNFADNVEQSMTTAVEGSGKQGITLVDLLEQLNPQLGRWPQGDTIVALAFPVVGHLERALATGRFELVRDANEPARTRVAR